MLGTYNSFTQTFTSGLIAEGVFLSTESHNIEVELGTVTKEYNNKEFLKGFSFSYSGKINLGSEYFFEFKPGILLSQKAYDGLQFGLNLRKGFNRFFGFLGLNYNYNFNPSHGIVNNEKPLDWTSSYIFGVGFQINKTFGLLISYNKLFNSYFGSGQTTDYIKGVGYKKYLHYLAKFGIELNL